MANLGKLIYDAAMNNVPKEYSGISKKEMATEINKQILNVLGLEKYEARAFSKAMRKHGVEVFEIIEEVANQVMANGDYLKDSFFNQFVETKNLALGDTNEFYVEGEGSLEVVEFSGNSFNINRDRYDVGETFGVTMKDFGIKVYEYAERIASGRADYGKLVSDITVAIDKFFSELAQSTFAKALTNLPSEFVASGSYDEEDIITLLQHVEAAGGTKPYLLGTTLALSKLQGITDVSVYSDKMKNTLNQNITLPVWKGYRCVTIPQGHKKGTFDFTMENNVVYVLSGDEKPVKLCIEGDTEYKEIANVWDGSMNADKSVEQTLTFKAGCRVAYNKMFGRIDVA